MTTSVDWARMAAPQPDGYDIRQTLQVLMTSRYGKRPTRQVPQDTPLIWPEGQARFVRLADNITPSSGLRDMAWDEPRVVAGLALIDTWPAVRPMCAHLIVGLCALTSGRPQEGHGCTCGNFGDDWGWIYVTADNSWGFAEGIVHEMAHWKLRAFGVWFEEWEDTLLLNKPDELYTSPVRKDMPRPMGAVLHAQYSYVHVAALCNAMLKADPSPTGAMVGWAQLQLDRVTEGQGTLQQHARGTPDAGVPFLESFYEWTAQVITEGKIIIAGLTTGQA